MSDTAFTEKELLALGSLVLKTIQNTPGTDPELRILLNISRKLENGLQEVSELTQLFDLQRKRMDAAVEFWQRATGKYHVYPDLGDLLEFMINGIEHHRSKKEELLKTMRLLLEWLKVSRAPGAFGAYSFTRKHGDVEMMARKAVRGD